MTKQFVVLLTVLALSVLAQIAQAQSICRISLVGSGTAPSGPTIAASAIRSASVSCEGEDLSVTGPAALRNFAADWTGVTFTASAQAPALLTINGSQVTIQQSTFRNLNLASGSLLEVAEGTLNITGSSFSGNTVRGAGSVLNINQTDASIRATTFQGNSAEGFGGALSGSQGTLSVTDSRFIENQSGVAGGAISYVGPQASQAVFRNVTISSNVAVCRGGAVYLNFVDEVTFTDSVIANNSVTEFNDSPTAGGVCNSQYRFSQTAGNGMYVGQYTNAAINNSLVDANEGNGDGGLFLFTGVTTRLTNSNITNNKQDSGIVAGLLAPSHTTVIIAGCLFANNTGASTGGFLCQGCAGLNVTDSIFEQNEALENSRGTATGGAMTIVACCARLCFMADNQFLGNKALSGDGGGIYAVAPVNLTMVDNLFDGNEAGNAGGILVSGSGETLRDNNFIVTSNVFRRNKAGGATGIGGGMGFAELRTIQVSNCTFDGNSATTAGGGLYIVGLESTTGSASNCTFVNNDSPDGAGGALNVFTVSRFTIEDSSFINNTALSGGGSYTARCGSVIYSNVTYDANSARDDSGALHSETTNRIEFNDSTFTQNSVSRGFGGASLMSEFDQALISNCQFEGNSVKPVANAPGGDGGAIWSRQGENMTLQDSTFDSNVAGENGGGFFGSGLARISILGSNFTNCSAGTSGGGITLTGSAVQVFSRVSLRNNTAPIGGGAAVRNVTESWSLVNGTVDANGASNTGGGLFLADIPAASKLNITGSAITNNQAEQQGGGIAFVTSPGATLNIADTTISDNKADAGGGLYGDSGVLFANSDLQQNGNSASRAGTADVGCGDCRVQINAGSIATVSNAPATTEDQTSGVSAAAGGGGSSLSGGAIAGIVIGVLAAVVLLAALAFLLLRRRKAKKTDVEAGKTSAVNRRPPVKSAFSEEGTGSFWSRNRSTPNGSVNEHTGGALDGFSSHEFDTDKSAKTAPSYTSSAPLINLHSGMSNGSNVTNTTDMTIPGVPWSDWQIDAKDIQVARRDDGREWKLGGGAFGEVYKALLKGVNPVAVKVLRDQSYTSRDEFSKEVALLKALHNSHIVQFQGACVEEDKMLLITEFMDGGDLFKAIERKQVTWQLRGKSIAMDVLRGLHFLHSKRIVHMDLKSPNILLTRHGVAKLADVGLAKVIRDRNYITQVSVIGTFAWAAPEVLTNERCTEKADIFSFGIVLWEIVTGEKPVRGGRRNVSVPDECSQDVADIIAACLQTDPDKRPAASEVLEQLSALDSEQEPDVLSL